MEGDAGDGKKKLQCCVGAAFSHLAGQVSVRKVPHGLWLVDSRRELKLALRVRCLSRNSSFGGNTHPVSRSGSLASRPKPASAGELYVATGIYPRARWDVPCTPPGD